MKTLLILLVLMGACTCDARYMSHEAADASTHDAGDAQPCGTDADVPVEDATLDADTAS